MDSEREIRDALRRNALFPEFTSKNTCFFLQISPLLFILSLKSVFFYYLFLHRSAVVGFLRVASQVDSKRRGGGAGAAAAAGAVAP